MANFLKFSMVVWTVDKDGKRYPGAQPLLFRLETPIKDFRVSAFGFGQGLFVHWEGLCEQEVLQRYAEQGGPSGVWPELSEKYEKRKMKTYGARGLLDASGEMMRSLMGGAGYVFTQTALGMKWGSNNPLTGYHQRGHSTPTPLPQRRLWDPGPEFGAGLQSDAVRYVAARYRQEGFRVAKEAGVSLSRVQASQVGRGVLGGGYGVSLSG